MPISVKKKLINPTEYYDKMADMTERILQQTLDAGGYKRRFGWDSLGDSLMNKLPLFFLKSQYLSRESLLC